MIDTPLTRRSFLPAGLALSGLGLQLVGAHAADAPASAHGGLTAAPTSMSGVSPRLTVHAIDSFNGVTGAGLKYDLSRYEGNAWKPLKSVLALAGGRPADPLLIGDEYRAGRYEILLNLDDYCDDGCEAAAAGFPVQGAAALRDQRRVAARAPRGSLFPLGLLVLPRQLEMTAPTSLRSCPPRGRSAALGRPGGG